MPRILSKPLTVGTEVIDVHRHVNNQEYLRWMQEVAIEHSTAQGWPMARYLDISASWFVRSHLIEYLRPALLGDELLVCTWVAEMARRNSLRRTLFLRPGDHAVVAQAETQWIFVDLANGRPMPIPDAVREAFPVIASLDAVLQEIAWT